MNATALPVQVVASDVTTVAAGKFHSLYLKSDGSLWAMGANDHGQLGDGTVTHRAAPVRVVTSGIIAVASRNDHTLFIRSDSSLWAMGDNYYGQLGDGTTGSSTVPLLVEARGVTAVAAGDAHTAYLKSDGSLWATGRNDRGQLGDGTTVHRSHPVPVVPGGVLMVSAGADHTVYATTDDALWLTGDNRHRQLSHTVTADYLTTPVRLTHSPAVNRRPQVALGAALTVSMGQPVLDLYPSVIDDDLPSMHLAYSWRRDSGPATVRFSDTTARDIRVTFDTTGTYVLRLRVSDHQLADSASVTVHVIDRIDSLPGTPTDKTLSAQGYSGHLIRADGSLWGMGVNAFGQLGTGQYHRGDSLAALPGPIGTGPFLRVSTGWHHSLLIKADSSLWATGRNSYGQLGTGGARPAYNAFFHTANEANTGWHYAPLRIEADSVADMASGSGHSLYVKTDGSLWAMGKNNYGQLGDGTTTYRHAPVAVESSGVVAVAAGGNHSLYLKRDGSLRAMGSNYRGQLGDSTVTDRHTPVIIETAGVTAIATGDYHSLYLKSDGSLWAVGSNHYGQLGDGTTEDKPTPVRIEASGVTAIAAGSRHSLYLKSDGSLRAMGDNLHGQLGDGTTTHRLTPVQVEPSGVTAIAAGAEHSLYRKGSGELWGMGSNRAHQLGLPAITDYPSPQRNIVLSSYRVTFAADPGGTITGDTLQITDYDGTTTAVTAVADSLYRFDRWSDGNTDNPRTLTNVTSDSTITAIFIEPAPPRPIDGVILSQAFTFDALNRRSSVVERDSIIWSYAYDSLGNLSRAEKVHPGDSARDLAFAYTYDDIGNRIRAEEDGLVTTYTTNDIQQYTEVNEGGTITTLTYDQAGNPHRIGDWSVTWDGEDRARAFTDPVSGVTIEFAYDYRGFVGSKKVTDGTGTVVKHIGYLYDGNLISDEIDYLNDRQIIRSYTWGLDPAGTRQQVGGIGALLAVEETQPDDSVNTYYVISDAGGNVRQLVRSHADGTLTLADSIDYGPFGQVIASSTNTGNPFRFNTKRIDPELGENHYDYGYRRYSSTSGRWWNRDPIGVNGGINLYNSVSNNMVNGFGGTFGFNAGMGLYIGYFIVGLRVDSFGFLDEITAKKWKELGDQRKRLIDLRLKMFGKRFDVGECNSPDCRKVTILIELPHSSQGGTGHVGVAFDGQQYYDFGPRNDYEKGDGVVPARQYWDHPEKLYRFSIKERESLTPEKIKLNHIIREHKDSYRDIARIDICMPKLLCDNAEKAYQKLYREIEQGTALYSVPGQHCTSVPCKALKLTTGIMGPGVMAPAKLFQLLTRTKHSCGSNKGKLAKVTFISRE